MQTHSYKSAFLNAYIRFGISHTQVTTMKSHSFGSSFARPGRSEARGPLRAQHALVAEGFLRVLYYTMLY